jgi:hypothetical protein
VYNELRVGDAIILNMDLVHRSGINVSNKFRISLIERYHNTIAGDFNSGLNVYKYTDPKLNKKYKMDINKFYKEFTSFVFQDLSWLPLYKKEDGSFIENADNNAEKYIKDSLKIFSLKESDLKKKNI